MATVLIASLGDSPVVVTAMFDLLSDLLQKEQKSIDQLKVFYPANEFASVGYEDLILPSLQKKCDVQGISLDFEDVSGEDAAYNFLHKMYLELDKHQKNGDIVYLSLAGGRKSMATLMALLAPLFTCVKKLYHILDKDEGKKNDHFLTTGQLHSLPPTDRQRFLFPSHERVNLISIPYAYGEQHLNEEVKSLLYAPLTDEQLDMLWEQDTEEAKAITYYNQMNKNNDQGKFINVELTKAVVEQYREMRKFDVTHAKNFAKCFYQMHFAVYLDRNAHDLYSYKDKSKKRLFHYYKRIRTAERPVFYTDPVDIKANPEADIKRVVVSALPIEDEERTPRYPPLKEIVKKLTFPLETEKLEDAFPQESAEPEEHILIVPLATSPMVATQLYQLYIDKGHTIHSVILVHTKHADVLASVKIACEAFTSKDVKHKLVPLEGWEDIDTPDACIAYQALLEQTIREQRQQNPSCQIELTISGGRKGMAALATFAAQQQGIHYVVHTTISKSISDKVFEETTIEKLESLIHTNNEKTRNDRLFLDYYKKNKDAFILFKIPVIPVQKG